MAGGIDGAAHVADAGCNPGRGFVVHHAYRLDALPGVGAQALLDRIRIGAVAPVGRQEFDLQAELRRHLLPQGGEVARFGHQHAIAGRQAVHQGSFPRAGTGGGVDHYFALGALENALHPREHALAEIGELRTAMVHRREVDCA